MNITELNAGIYSGEASLFRRWYHHQLVAEQMQQLKLSSQKQQSNSTEFPDSGLTVTNETEITAIFDALNDEDALGILETIEDESLSVKEISSRCELPPSTAYRKVNQLSALDLLEEEIDITPDGKHPSVYHRRFDTICVCLTQDGFELQLGSQNDYSSK